MRKRKFSEEQIAIALRQGRHTGGGHLSEAGDQSGDFFSVEEDQRQHSECLSSES